MATLVRWEPFRELATLQTEMSRLMNGLFEGNGRTTAQAWVPPVDVWETQDEVVYSFDLPGVPESAIEVELQDDTLTISAQREQSQERSEDGFYRVERRYGTFSRTLAVPQGVAADSVKAELKDGVLEVRVAKPETTKPQRIRIGVEGSGNEPIDGTATSA
ncbi:MAG TPA: Hsp20/alpha crystallin family protein [Gaiellaceae bacterium]|nr:Hsp20/alpha crystallin family protein [Gaiellaceae bacterium]